MRAEFHHSNNPTDWNFELGPIEKIRKQQLIYQEHTVPPTLNKPWNRTRIYVRIIPRRVTVFCPGDGGRCSAFTRRGTKATLILQKQKASPFGGDEEGVLCPTS